MIKIDLESVKEREHKRRLEQLKAALLECAASGDFRNALEEHGHIQSATEKNEVKS